MQTGQVQGITDTDRRGAIAYERVSHEGTSLVLVLVSNELCTKVNKHTDKRTKYVLQLNTH